MAFNNVPANGWPQIKKLEELDAIAQKIDNLPTFTSTDRDWMDVWESKLPELPADPETDGVKVLTATTESGETVKSWEDPASGGLNYSTTEQKTGLKWIDGKDIYQKTLTADLSVNANEDIDITALSVDTIVKTDLCCKYGTYQIGESFFRDGTTEYIRSYTRLDSEIMYLRVSRGSQYPISSAVYVTILYTKATT